MRLLRQALARLKQTNQASRPMRCREALICRFPGDRWGKPALTVWALGQLGDQRALPFLRSLATGQSCDHETNLCQGEIQEAIQKLESNSFNLPAFLWRGVLKY